ncbi:Style cell-cycle inhibitor 1-A-like protein [Drosera capensis]
MARERESKSSSSKKKRVMTSDADSEDEGRNKYHRSSEEKPKRRKEEKSGRRKEEKSGRRKQEKDSKRKSKKEKKPGGKDRSSPQDGGVDSDFEFTKISSDDYYSKNNEFATWLKEKRKLFFSDLASETAHQLFTEFITDWNQQKLEAIYYKGIKSGPRTAHNWKIKA